ncbi:MAG: hypothetical protein AAFX93_13570 [Verrucomicrobiota bacterium]
MSKIQRFLVGFALGGGVALFIAITKVIDTASGDLSETEWWVSTGFMILILGALAGSLPFIAGPLIAGYRQMLSPLGVSEVEMNIPILGATKVQLGNPQRAAARRIFHEMTTRTVIQPLNNEDGNIREALNSLYQFFQIVRDELKEMPPTPSNTQKTAITLESICHRMLNHAVRPYLSRWHPRLQDWEGTNLGEADWPLNAICRRDLEKMRAIAAEYAKNLGNAANIPGYENMVSESASLAGTQPDISEEDLGEFERWDAAIKGAPSLEHRQTCWLLSVEMAGFSAQCSSWQTNTLIFDPITKRLQELIRNITWRIGGLLPTPGATDADEAGLLAIDELEEIHGRLVNAAPTALTDLATCLDKHSKAFEKIAREATGGTSIDEAK